MVRSILLLLLTTLYVVVADIYFHGPRGSNNRLNEKSAQRTNANRVFDSQNNNRGGYNVGDRLSTAAKTASDQYQMVYFQSSKLSKSGKGDHGVTSLSIEWTNQHGCGGNEDDNPHKLNCQLVLQYMCQPDDVTGTDEMRDGIRTNTQNYQPPPNGETLAQFDARKKRNVRVDRAYQESFEWYDKCVTRDRNEGLFIADQKVGPKAKNTRQNPNGNRHGYECPEERDYYPYWHPTDWRDIGVFSENKTMCSHYQSKSFNVQSKWECVEKWKNGKVKHYSKYNNKIDCEANKGQWLEFHNYLEKAPTYKTEDTCKKKNAASTTHYFWGRPIHGSKKECLVGVDKPFCMESPFTRDNHLGNGVDLKPLHMTWKIPYFPSGKTQKCVLRMRYNITTDDYDPYFTNSSRNGVKSPVKQNPAVDIGVDNTPMRLAINTAQYGRTFQDRTHVFLLKARPSGGAAGDLSNAVIHNLNVRGKRGNIVQVYPAVEYDFFPTDLQMEENDLVHIQWTGSNTHNNGNPAGDGQAGDDGQGKDGSDRSNILGLLDRNINFPLDITSPKNLFSNVKSVKWVASPDVDAKKLKGEDISVQFATGGYYSCVKETTCKKASLEKKVALDKLLNNAPASFGGMLLQLKKGTYDYMCTRNNNFTNRSQKATIIVT